MMLPGVCSDCCGLPALVGQAAFSCFPYQVCHRQIFKDDSLCLVMGEDVPDWVEAEKHVAGLLDELSGEGYLILNNIGFRYGNIDHLVIRPDGSISLVETKSQKGRVSWDGRQLLLNGRPFRENYLCQVNRSIRWLRQMAKSIWKVNPWFVAVIVFPNAEVDIRRPVKQVHVLNSRELFRFIRETTGR